ncbi:hypothetical protein [Mycobacterium intracellulare]|uniref:hypothetical protein n=1 Tax=Mycobacterium intracellulare TaxID=1767 RepID=UPI00080BD2BB|nr:hypothetical protein [Mycobacterium intracellulare]OCB15099.1 hypothetical protein A5689_26965 [Mycobacterium intracellulare subsp. yongonense]
MNRHNPAARYCIEIDDYVTVTDEAICEACDELQAAVKLDPDLYDDVGNPRDITHAKPYDPARATAAREAFDAFGKR